MEPLPFTSDNIHGSKDHQIRARRIFPVLIELAIDKNRLAITYGGLADRINYPNPRNMSKPLGCIWKSLYEYQETSGLDIPYLTTIVVAKDTRLPTYYKNNLGWSETKIRSEQELVYQFEHWTTIIESLLS